MVDFARELLPVNLEDEMRQSYLDYAMSVIIGRALPDVRDGLKPVHRRVLYVMHEQSNDWNKPYKKSARIVGDVMGKYHPHGDSAIYDTMVRMAQTFSMRYVLVDGQGNFGSVDGDAPAAMRYTEVRMARLAHEMLSDIDKETVDYVDNYDGAEQEPSVFPTHLPNLLVNGSAGIAVGMATNIPPHNLTEVINACIALIADPEIDIPGLMQHLPGPDFPTAGIINGVQGIREAYATGRGRIYLRARCEFEEISNDRQRIVVTELPYQVNKAKLIEKIAELVKEKRLEGISELRDESDKDGMRMVVDLKRGEMPEVVLNNLYQHTQMQNVFGINMVALTEGQPRLLNLKQVLEAFIRHRREVVTRRTIYELRKARERAHVLEGLAVALANIDAIIALIRAAPNPAEAKRGLTEHLWEPGPVTAMLARTGAEASRPEGLAPDLGLTAEGYRLSPEQSQAILDLRLHRLTGLEQDKIVDEFKEILDKIAELLTILADPDRLMAVIREELQALRDQFGDRRRSEIVESRVDLSDEDLITDEDMVVTLSRAGYAKAQPLADYRAQRRGGRGKSVANLKDEDVVDKLFVANTHATILCFSSRGKVYWLKVHQLPVAGRSARGRPIVNLLPLESAERINAVLAIRQFSAEQFVLMVTAAGTVKKVALSEFSRPRAAGIIAIDLRVDDRLVGVALTDGEQDVTLVSAAGKAIRFQESEVRAMGRTAYGVRGMNLPAGQQVVGMLIGSEGDLLIATERGFGKRTPISEFPRYRRGGQGVIAIQTGGRNGPVVGAVAVQATDEVMLITDNGTLVRTPAEDVSCMGRNTQGVTLIRLDTKEKLVELARVERLNGNEEPPVAEAETTGEDAAAD